MYRKLIACFSAAARVASMRTGATVLALLGFAGADSPAAAPNEFEFSQATYTVNENFPGYATVAVIYGGGNAVPVTITCVTSGGTAVPGTDYLSQSNTFTFNPGDVTTNFTVPVFDDTLTNGSRTIGLLLSSPGGGAVLGAQFSATIVISDNETLTNVPPANDHFSNAVAIAGLSGNVGSTRTNTFATKQAGEPNHAGNVGGASVWFRWTAPISGSVTFSTAGSVFDTLMAVYTGNAVGSLTPVAANDNFGGGQQSSVTFTAVAGTVYRIAVDGFGGLVGNYQLAWGSAGSAGQFGFTTSLYEANEGESFPATYLNAGRSLIGTRVTVTRAGSAVGRVIVTYAVNNGTGVRGTQYNLTDPTTQTAGAAGFTGTLVFDHLQTSASFLIQTLNGVPIGGASTVGLTITGVSLAPGESAAIIAPTISPFAANSTLLIYDGGAGPLSTIGVNFERIRFRTTESLTNNSVRIRVYRGSDTTDGAANSIRINFPPTPNNNFFQLDAGADYAFPTNRDIGTPFVVTGADPISFVGVMSWPAGTLFHDIEIPIINDSEVEFNEDITFELFLAGGQTATPGRSDTCYVTIVAEDNVTGEHSAGSLDPSWNRDYFLGTSPPNNSTPGANNTVHAVGVQANGRSVIAGDFTSVNTVPRNRIARFLADGQLDTTFNPGTGANATINALAIQTNQQILIAGNFNSYNGILRNGIARIGTNGLIDLSFNPGSGANGPVRALALYTNGPNIGKIIVVGDFTQFAGTNFNRIVRLNAGGSIDSSFNAGAGANGPIQGVAIQGNGAVVIGGEFTSVQGVSFNRVARLGASGALDPTFAPGTGADGIVYAVGLDTGNAVTSISTNVNRAASGGQAEDIFDLNFTSASVPPGALYSGVLSINYDFLFEPDTMDVYLGTNQSPVSRIGGTPLTNGVATLNIPFGPSTNTIIRIVVNQGNNTSPTTIWSYSASLNANATIGADEAAKIIIGGEFTTFDLRPRSKVARLNFDGTLDTGYEVGTGFDDTVYTIRMDPGSRAVFGGLLTSFNGTRRTGLARLLGNGSLDTSFMDPSYNQFAGIPTRFSPQVEPKNFIRSIALETNGNLIVGGSFKRVGGGGNNTTAFGASSPWLSPFNSPINTPTWITRDDIRNRFNVARLIGNSTPGPGNIEFTQDAYSVDESAAFLFLTLTRVNGILGPAFTQFLTTDRPAGPGAATAGTDYTSLLAFPTWDSTRLLSSPIRRTVADSFAGVNNTTAPTGDDIYLSIASDSITEGNETVNLRLDLPTSGLTLGGEVIPVGVALGKKSATLTIVDDDPLPTFIGFSTNSFTVDEAAGTATINVVRTGNLQNNFGVDYFTTDGSAIDTADYFARSGRLTFGPGETNQSFTIQINNDTAAELDETILLTLTNLTAGVSFAPGGNGSTLTIFDNDFASGQLRFSASAITVNENQGTMTVVVQRTGGNVGAIAVDYATSNLTATAGVDYTAVSNTLTWANGDTAPKSFTVMLLLDGLVDGNRQFDLRLSNARVLSDNSVVPIAGGNPSTVTIVDADNYGTLQFATSEFSVSENGGTAIVTVTRTGGSSETVSINYQVIPGTGIFGTDYASTNSVLTLGPGVTSANFPVAILDNAYQNTNVGGSFHRTVLLSLSSPTNGVLGAPASAILTIVDDERVNEPAGSVDTTYNAAAGANNFIYSLALQPDGRLLIGGDFTTFNGINRARIARLDVSGGLDTVFSPGSGINDSVRSISVQSDGRLIVGGNFNNIAGFARPFIGRLNADGSLDETFDPGAGADNPVFATAIHTDSANAGKIIVGGAFAQIGGVTRPFIARLNPLGTVDASFSAGLGPNATVFAAAIQGNGKVVIGGDFTTVDGVSSRSLARLNGDGSLDTNFTANLGTAFGGSVRAIVIQSDGKIIVGGLFTNLNGVAVNYLARLNANGTPDGSFAPNALPAAGGDGPVLGLALQPDGKVIAVGDFSRFSGVSRSRVTRLNGDGTVDPTINFGAAANNFVSAAVVQVPDGKIIVGGGFTTFDGLPRNYLARLHGGVIAGPGRFEFITSTYFAGENTTNAHVSVRRRGGTTSQVMVNAGTSDGTASSPADYIGTNAALLTFPQGETFQTLTLPLIDDLLVEGNETVNLALTAPTGGSTLGNQPVATLTLVDDDSYVSFSAAAYSVNENAAAGSVAVNVIRTGGTNGTFSLQVATSNLTATAGFDYLASTNTLTFQPGEVAKTVNISILDDSNGEGDEQFSVRLQNLSGSVSLTNTGFATVTIVENDFFPGVLAFGSPTGFFVDENSTNALITVVRTNGTAGTVTVNFATADGTASSSGTNIDYSLTNGVLTFADGETAKTFAVRVNSDLIIESNETVVLTLSAPTGGAVLNGPNPVTLTILNNNEFIFGSFRLSAAAYNVSEGAGTLAVNVVRTGGTTGTNTVDVATADGTALAGGDYTAFGTSLTYLPGEVLKTINIPILIDGLVESNETFTVNLANPLGGASIGSPTSSIVTITSTNILPGAFAFETNVFNALENGGPATITVLRTNGFTGNVSVNIRITEGAATAGVDYSLANNTITNLAWTNGDTAPKSFPIPLLNDVLVESGETVFLTLESPAGDAGTPVIATPGATLIIADDEVPAGSLDVTFGPGANNTVYALTVDSGALKLVAAGDFTQMNGSGRSNIARFNFDGTLDGFDAGSISLGGTNASIRALARYTNGPNNGKVIIGGLFTSVGGLGRTNLARLNSDGSLDGSFVASGINGVVHAIAIQNNGSVVIGGGFTSVENTPRGFLARLTGSGSLDGSFDMSLGADAAVRAVVLLTDGSILVGGDFTVVNGLSSPRVARISSAATVDGAFAAALAGGASDPVFAIAAQPDGRALVGGSFSNFSGSAAGRLVRLNTNGSRDLSFSVLTTNGGFNDSVLGIVLQPDGKPIVVGGFTALNGLAAGRIVRLETTGARDVSINFGTGANNFIDTVALQPDGVQGNGKIVIGGGFTTFAGQTASYIARLNNGENLGNGVLQFSSAGFSVTEQGTNAVVVVERFGGASNTVTVAFATADGSAQAAQDYFPTNGTLTFVPGEVVKSFLVPIINDSFLETNESFTATLSVPGGGATLGAVTNATVTILEDDGTISFLSPAFAVNENATNAILTVIRTGGTAGAAGVSFGTFDGTALAGLDYTATAGSITFNPGETSKTFTVPIVDDALIEGIETLGLVLSNATGSAVLGGTNAVLNIIDNDVAAGLISFEVADYVIDEAGGAVAVTLLRTNGSLGAVSVRLQTGDVTASAPGDYTAFDGFVSFADGELVKTVFIPVLDDILSEGLETVALTLSGPTGGAALGPIPAATLTIIDNDASVQFASPVYTVDETGVIVAITVERRGTTNNTLSVNYTTLTTGTALPGSDFLPASGTFTFLPGETNMTFTITILDDTFIEGTETIDLQLSGVIGGYLDVNGTARVDLIDNDSVVNFDSATYTVNETGTNVLITLVRTGNLNFAATVTYAMLNGTATDGLDFAGGTNTVNFLAGETNQTFLVTVFNDTLVESNETVNLQLVSAVGGSSLGGLTNAVLTIQDDDLYGSIFFASATYTNAESGLLATITLQRTNGTAGPVSVNFTTADGTAVSTGTNADYLATNGVVVFADGQTNQTFTVVLINDSLVENDETVGLTLSNPAGGAALGSLTAATLNIVNDDFFGTLQFTATNYSVVEGAGTATISVARIGGSAGAVGVNFAATAGTASAGGDFTATSGTLSWADGDGTDKTFTVAIANDSSGEASETVNLALSGATGGASLGAPLAAALTIVDDDLSVAFSGAAYTVNEAAGSALITINRLGVTNGSVSVTFYTTNGTAQAGSDYTSTVGSVTWADGDGSPKTFNVPTFNDTAVEGSETLRLFLATPVGATLTDPTEATLTIVDDDASATFVPAGAVLLSEVGGTVNGAVDPGETVTLTLAVRNIGASDTANLVGTIFNSNGVTGVSGPQPYGVAIASGPAVARQYTFTASGTNGGTVTAVLQLQDGAVNHGAVPFIFHLGSKTNKFLNATPIVLNDSSTASPYPSSVNVTGIQGNVTKVTVTISNLSHTFPGDIDLVLVSPTGQKVMLMSDAGSSSAFPNPVSNVTLTFDDSAATSLTTNALVTGTNKPTNLTIGGADFFPPPGPSAPFAGTLAAFNGINPNGTWSLYAVDDNTVDLGSIAGGWCLNFIEASRVNPLGDLAVVVTDTPDPAVAGQQVTYTLTVTNAGSSTAENVALTNTLPGGFSHAAITNTHGSFYQSGNTVIFQLGSIAAGGARSVTVVANTATAGVFTDTANVTSTLSDTASGNNAAITGTTVFEAADIGLALTDSPDPVAVGADLIYSLVITNRGPSTATGVALSDTLPTGATFISVGTTQGSASQGAGLVTASLGAIASGGSATVTITVRPLAVGTVTNAAVVSATQTDLNPGDNSASVKTTVILLPTLSQSMSGNSLVLRWPLEAGNFILEYCDSLTAPITWVPESITPAVNGGSFEAVIPISPVAPVRFYRLRVGP